MSGICSGMIHLSSQGIVHRDLAARNILLSGDLTAKVSDFGLSRIIDTNSIVYSSSNMGPLMWMSPEALRKKQYSEKTGVWSFGVCCCEILSNCNIYHGLDAVQVATAVVVDGLKPIIPKGTPHLLAGLLQKCFDYEAENRPSFVEILPKLSEIKINRKI